MASFFCSSFLALIFASCLWLGLVLAQLPCSDYTNEDKCLADAGNSETASRCVFDNNSCKCGLQTPTDVVFLFDRNDFSNDDSLFQAQRQWLAEVIVDSMTTDSRVAVIVYCDTTVLHMSLTDSASMSASERAQRVREIEFVDDCSDVVSGQAVADSLALFTAQGRMQAEKVLVLLSTSDPHCMGCNEDGVRVRPCVYNPQLASENITVVTLAGHTSFDGLTSDGINALKCLGNGNSNTRAFFQEFSISDVNAWKHLVKPTINAGTCPVVQLRQNNCAPIATDVAFVIDASSSYLNATFWTQNAWIGRLITDSLPHKDSRFAFIRFATESEILSNFTSDTKRDIEDDYTFSQLIDWSRGVSNTADAISDTLVVFADIENEEKHSRRLMILVTDSEPTDGSSICGRKVLLELLDIMSIVVFVGEQSSAQTLQCLADEMVVVPNFSENSFRTVSDFVTELMTQTLEPVTTTTPKPTGNKKKNDKLISSSWKWLLYLAVAVIMICMIAAYAEVSIWYWRKREELNSSPLHKPAVDVSTPLPVEFELASAAECVPIMAATADANEVQYIKQVVSEGIREASASQPKLQIQVPQPPPVPPPLPQRGRRAPPPPRRYQSDDF